MAKYLDLLTRERYHNADKERGRRDVRPDFTGMEWRCSLGVVTLNRQNHYMVVVDCR